MATASRNGGIYTGMRAGGQGRRAPADRRGVTNDSPGFAIHGTGTRLDCPTFNQLPLRIPVITPEANMKNALVCIAVAAAGLVIQAMVGAVPTIMMTV